MNSLAIFDIDGTLTDTTVVDDSCYRAAVAETIGLPIGAIDWTGTPHHSDRGIFDWLYERLGRALPSESDVALARRRLADRLTQARSDAPEQFAPIEGAPSVFGHLTASGWDVTIATGCWLPSAMIKLDAGSINARDVPIACSDDAPARVDIVTLARQRAEAFYGRQFDRIVSIGDGVWDVEAARSLELPFIGVGHGERASRLRRAGATTVVENYLDLPSFTRALEGARMPDAPEQRRIPRRRRET
jgi:phosphoglycolate phosphatase-like HAD superfamily hydrolase